MIRITVLSVPGCPNAPVVRERIAAALAGRAAAVELVEIADDARAARWGMTGSPTVLVDGVDPFAVAGAGPSVSCRLYADGDGRPAQGAPGVADLRRALEAAGLPDAGACRPPADVLDPVGRAGRGRLAPAEGGLRAVQRVVLRHFAATGRAPQPEDLEPHAAPFGRSAREVLAELAAEDFLTLSGAGASGAGASGAGASGAGAIQAAYPFSAVPTAHRVRISGGAEVWSMCAIDALGIPVMLQCDAVISSRDPVTAAAVTVTASGGRMVWEPPTAVVFVGRRSGAGPAAAVCCDALNFFTGTDTARIWTGRHPDISGQVVSRSEAERLGARTFGALLGAPPPA